jgi:fucose permease
MEGSLREVSASAEVSDDAGLAETLVMRPTRQARIPLGRGRAAVTAAFAAHALIAGFLGPWIPDLRERSGLDEAGLGVALTVFAVGLLAGTRLAGPVVRRIGGRGAVRLGIPAFGGGFAMLPLANGLASLAAILFLAGLMAGLIDVAMNIEAVEVERLVERRLMTSIHGAWSVFVFLGAGVASLGVASGVPIEVHLPVAAVAVVAGSAALLRWLPAGTARGDARGALGAGALRRGERRDVVLLCVVAGSSFLVEGIAIEWSALFLRESVGVAARAAGLGVVAFSAGMAVARFVGDRVVARVGQAAVVRVGAASAFVALAGIVAIDDDVVSIVAFAVVGLGLGPVVPLAFRAAGWTERRDGASALPIVVTAGYTRSIVGPALVGFVADAVGLRLAFLVPLVAVAFAALAAGATRDR